MSLIQRVTRVGATPEVARPDPAKLVSGNPIHTTWNIEDHGGLYAGLWHSTPGKWRVSYAEWEYFHIISGYSILTGSDGSVTQLHSGDSLIIRPGFEGTWEVIETTLKDYVIRT